jgi:uncharacterized protein
MMKKTILIVSAAIAVFFLVYCWHYGLNLRASKVDFAQSASLYKTADVQIGAERVRAMVSDTEELRAKGLSGQDGLNAAEGMLFVFEREGYWGFWMKDMKFSIDIAWIGSDMRIVHIEKRVAPETFPKVFSPTKRALYVVELQAGALDRIGASIGDKISVPDDLEVGK